MKKFHLELSDPVIVTQGEVGDQAWGHYQFPRFFLTKEGNICCSWEYSNDSIEYDGKNGYVISEDQGKSWRPLREDDTILPLVKMKNGKYFAGFRSRGAHPVDWFDNYTPGFTQHNRRVYFAEDIDCSPEDTEVYASEYDPETGETTEFKVTVNWPFMPLSEHAGLKAYPVTQVFALCDSTGHLYLRDDDDMYYVLYTKGFDSTAKTREEAVMKYNHYSSVYVFKSSDFGRTWDYLSQISIDDDSFSEKTRFEGFDEPMMAQMPDGSVVMLIRTGCDHPSYIARSTDKCRTWSKPAVFDDIGVLPQIKALGCGVTVATYGRPEMRVRATSDPAGLVWEDPITVPLITDPDNVDIYNRNVSCFYTRLLPLDDHTVLWTYTEFLHPNAEGQPVKTVLTRTITVVED